MTPEQFDQLPKWARDHIASLQNQRDAARDRLDKMCDDQTPTDMWVLHIECAHGEYREIKQYIDGRRIEVECKGVRLDVNLTERGLELSWRPVGRGVPTGDLCFMPTSYQQALIVNLAYDPDEFQRLVDQRERYEKHDNN